MCGVTGYINFNKEHPAVFSRVKKMTDALSHRGPDGEGFYLKDNIALGHRRLKIIDLVTGDQPMFNDDQSIIIIFNGEIYNYIEIKNELKASGIKFKTKSDTEVILKAYEYYGLSCLNKFNGAWSIAIWDQSNNHLFLSRDRMGEKPLYYYNNDDYFVFGSEIKSLLAFGIEKIPNLEFTELYLSLISIPAPFTYYKDIYQLEPAHYLLVKDGKINKFSYWNLPEIDENNMISDKKIIYERFEYYLRDSVNIRMRSDVAYGAFLSGGLDSSSVVAIMAENSLKPIETFTMGFKNHFYDESLLANLVAKKFQTNHHLGTLLQDRFDQALEMVLQYYDEPFGDSSAIPTGYISKYANEYVKMVLTGDGGDEVLSGYVAYQGLKLTGIYNSLPNFLRKSIPDILSLIESPLKGPLRFKVEKYRSAALIADLDFNTRMIRKIPTTNLKTIKELFPESYKRISIEDYFSQVMSQCTYKDDFYKLMFFNLMHSLPNDMLTKVDRMSMAHSLEARVPFIDYRLIEFMVHVNKNIKMQGFERKSILRNTIGKHLPKQLLQASKKGFGIPLLDWFNDSSFNVKLDSLINTDMGFNTKPIQNIIEDNRSGRKDHGNFIWMLFLLKKWLHD
jgi:asparagine synthase (glutamine-hydrolysing)